MLGGFAPTDDFFIVGAGADRRSVQAWATKLIPFEPREDVRRFRDELRQQIALLRSTGDEFLHASFEGPKPANADIENLLLYNLGGACFEDATRRGVCFEHAATNARADPTGRTFAHYYSYTVAALRDGFDRWQVGRELARFDAVSLGSFIGPKQLEQAWWAVAGAGAFVAERSRAPGDPFAVRLRLRPPAGRSANAVSLVKGVLDGVVCALQAHTDIHTVGGLSERLARVINASPEAIADRLTDTREAVLGTVPQLLHARGNGVQWRPEDHLLVAGALELEAASGNEWLISGVVNEVEQAGQAAVPAG